MSPLTLHDFHAARGASFTPLNGAEAVASYGQVEREYLALTKKAALIDLSFRSRVCLLGADREKFLHGQVTNDVLKLKPGEGCYAALVTAKGKMQSDLFIYKLRGELLLDFEPGLTAEILQRLEKYIIADDVQAVDVAPDYGVLSVSGPEARPVLAAITTNLPEAPLTWTANSDEGGETYVMNNPRFGVAGYDLFVPLQSMEKVALALENAGRDCGAGWAGFEATEIVRIENGIPRFGADMNGNTLPQEAEIEERAISYAKGCYIGQEIIARIRTYGQVAKALRVLRLPSEPSELPARGTKLFAGGKEAGWISSSTFSPKCGAKIALAYVRKEVNGVGTMLALGDENGNEGQITGLPGKPGGV